MYILYMHMYKGVTGGNGAEPKEGGREGGREGERRMEEGEEKEGVKQWY